MTTVAWRNARRRNFTRTSPSIAGRLINERKWHLLPLYAIARTSDLAREGIENSGSFSFADHIYRARPSGRYGIGWLLDGLLLALPASRSMRERYLHARSSVAQEILRAASARQGSRILSVPCGIARELVGGANDALLFAPGSLPNVCLLGMDVDAEALELSRALADGAGEFEFLVGDALDPSSYPAELDLITSTGLGEFLTDDELARFYLACFGALKPGGRFVTSAMSRSRVADTLLRELAELHTHYRDATAISAALTRAGFSDVRVDPDRFGLQWLASAVRPLEGA